MTITNISFQFKHNPFADVLIIQSNVFVDERGCFMESFNTAQFAQLLAEQGQVAPTFVQDNQSSSHCGVIRGLHYQLPPHAQAKLVRVSAGKSWDVVVDIREHSATFGQWFGLELSRDNALMLWVPEGFAHGFMALSDHTQLHYKTNNYYAPTAERSLQWNDPSIGINWPTLSDYSLANSSIMLSEKDLCAMTLAQAIASKSLF